MIKALAQVEELTKNYGDIFMIWFDTPVQMDEAKCQQRMDIVAKNQPGALVNSRLGGGYGHFDVSIDNGMTPSVSTATWLPDLKVPWQTHKSVTQGGWGYTTYGGENDRSKSYSDFIYSLSRIVCYGGVYLLNVGPRPDGTIPESQVNSIQAIGKWLKVNGEAIYGADRTLVHHFGNWAQGTAAECKHRISSIQNSRFSLVANTELYDLKVDPGETKNVITEHPEVVAKLRAIYNQWWLDVQPLLVNENTVGPKTNPMKELYWNQFGGGPSAALLRRMDPTNAIKMSNDIAARNERGWANRRIQP